jgi:hypothetical protein
LRAANHAGRDSWNAAVGGAPVADRVVESRREASRRRAHDAPRAGPEVDNLLGARQEIGAQR